MAPPEDPIQPQMQKATDLRNTGHAYESIEVYKEAMAQYDQMGEIAKSANCAHMIGVCYKILKKDTEAFDWYDKAIEGYQKAGDQVGVGNTQRDIGIMHEYYSRHDEALEWLQKSEATLAQTEDRNAYGITVAKIGALYTKTGVFAQAAEYMQRGLEIIRDHPKRSWFFEMTTLMHMVDLAFRQENYEHIGALGRQALGILIEEDQLAQQSRRVGQLYGGLAWYYLRKGEPTTAKNRFAQAMHAWEEMDAEGLQFVLHELRVEDFLTELASIDKGLAEDAQIAYEDII